MRLSALHKCYSMSLPVMSRWRLVLCEQKRQLVHSEGENNIDMSGLGCENLPVGSFLLFYVQIDLENSHFTSLGLHAVFKAELIYLLISIAWAAYNKCTLDDRLQSCMELGAGKPKRTECRTWENDKTSTLYLIECTYVCVCVCVVDGDTFWRGEVGVGRQSSLHKNEACELRRSVAPPFVSMCLAHVPLRWGM